MAAIDKLNNAVRNMKLGRNLHMGALRGFQKMNNLQNIGFFQFGSTIAFATIVTSMFFGPLQIFTSGAPMQIGSTVVVA